MVSKQSRGTLVLSTLVGGVFFRLGATAHAGDPTYRFDIPPEPLSQALIDFSTKLGIFETFRKLHPILKEQHFLNPKEEEDDPYESTQITALIANGHGIFGVYSMREVFEYTQFWAAGSGREFALGAMQAVYPRTRTAEAIAKVGVEAGAIFDKNSALPLTLYTLPLARRD